MRTVFLLFISVAALLPATESNPRVTRLMETFTASATAAEEVYQQAIQQAEAARAAALTTARDRTITGLKRLVNNRSGVAEQAEVYTQVLRLNREDADAVRFFTAIGTLEQVLAGLEPAVETDLVGNVVGAEQASAHSQRMGNQLAVFHAIHDPNPNRGFYPISDNNWPDEFTVHHLGPSSFRIHGTKSINTSIVNGHNNGHFGKAGFFAIPQNHQGTFRLSITAKGPLPSGARFTLGILTDEGPSIAYEIRSLRADGEVFTVETLSSGMVVRDGAGRQILELKSIPLGLGVGVTARGLGETLDVTVALTR